MQHISLSVISLVDQITMFSSSIFNISPYCGQIIGKFSLQFTFLHVLYLYATLMASNRDLMCVIIAILHHVKFRVCLFFV